MKAAVDFCVCQVCENLVSGRCWPLGKVGEKLLTKCLFSVPLNWSHPSVLAQKLGSVASDHMHWLLLGTGSETGCPQDLLTGSFMGTLLLLGLIEYSYRVPASRVAIMWAFERDEVGLYLASANS